MKTATDTIRDMTDDQKSNAIQTLRSVCEGVDVPLTHAEMKELEALGLVKELTNPSGRGCKANHYTFFHTDLLEDVFTILLLKNTVKQLQHDHEELLMEYWDSKKKEKAHMDSVTDKLKSISSLIEQLSGTDRNMPGKPNQNNLEGCSTSQL